MVLIYNIKRAMYRSKLDQYINEDIGPICLGFVIISLPIEILILLCRH